MEPIERLQHEFPNIEIKDLGYGANLYTRLGVVTIYWGKKKKYCINGKWEPYSDFERVLFEVAAYAHVLKKVAPVEPQPIQTGNRVQEAINHISRKRDFILENQPDNKLATFCLTLISELQQYL